MLEIKITKFGKIIVSENLISKVAGKAAIECYGVIGMVCNNFKEGLQKFFGKEQYDKGVQINYKNNICQINVHVILVYGVKIDIIAKNIMSQVIYSLNQYVPNLEKKINIFIDDISVLK